MKGLVVIFTAISVTAETDGGAAEKKPLQEKDA